MSGESGEKKVIPVQYLVEQPADLSMKIMHCTVALSPREIPDWLYPRTFDLIAYHGHTVMPLFGPADEILLSVPDADSFRYKVYGKILSDEQAREQSMSANRHPMSR